MYISRSQPSGLQLSGSPSPTAVPLVGARDEPPKAAGVIYTTGVDLNAMTLESQLEYGRNQGVFTKIRLQKDGITASSTAAAHGTQANGFVAAAVLTLKDFDEGLVTLKQQTTENSPQSGPFFGHKLLGVQGLRARLSAFA